MSNLSNKSAQPCGCDEAADWVCIYHGENPPARFPSPEQENDGHVSARYEVAPLPKETIYRPGPLPTDVPPFDLVLEEMRALHTRKKHDYAKDNNAFSNFEEAAAFAGVDVDTVFRVIIGIKIARLKELQTSGKTPQNESLDDSQMDLTMYGALRRAYHKKAQQ